MKKLAKRLVALLFACTILASFISCGTKETAGTDSDTGTSTDTSTSAGSNTGSDTNADDNTGTSASAKDTLNVAVSLDSGTLDPLGMTGSGGFLNVERTYMEPAL